MLKEHSSNVTMYILLVSKFEPFKSTSYGHDESSPLCLLDLSEEDEEPKQINTIIPSSLLPYEESDIESDISEAFDILQTPRFHENAGSSDKNGGKIHFVLFLTRKLLSN